MEAGVDRSNLRQYVDDIAKERGIVCQCIRCRELGRHDSHDEVIYNSMKYDASDGTEFFISADTKNQDAIVGFVRMRYPDEFLRPEITKDSAIIRELHVYGTAVAIGEEGEIQHKGVGKKLMQMAEEQAKKDGKNKMVVISGVGVREYYKRLGYRLEGPYMVKEI
jgi:elongator complex protein 3